MGSFNYHFLVVASLLFINAESSRNINHDQSSLLTLKSHITSDPYNVLRNNWTIVTSVCSWIGVSCDSGNNRVTELDISDMGLQGTIPPEIGNLSSLVSLNMSENLFHGLLPTSIFNMSSLQVLSFRNNSLSGSLPKDMCSGHSHLPRWLRVLRLSYNKFDGEIPSSLGQCSHLELISLAHNNFVGNVPGGIGNLSSLVNLLMSGNLLHGPVPTSIFSISSVQVVSFTNNSLSGNLPVDLCSHNTLPKLRELYLADNKFDGEIPLSLGQCSHLELIDLSDNGFVENVPGGIGNLSSLVYLYMTDNFLYGPIPTSIFNISSLEIVSFWNNSLSGNLPVDMCGHNNLPKLRELYLAYNKFGGEIPSSLGQCSQLELIDLTGNGFVGNVPDGIGNLSSLVNLYTTDNLLRGPIPISIFNISSLEVVSFRKNSFSGNLPVDMCNHNTLPKLRELYLTNNKFDGEIPSSLGQCSQLELITFSNNGFVGNVPSEIGNLSSLMRIFMYNNLLHGPIPSTVGNLSKLSYLNLHSNKIRGEIPPSLCNLRYLEHLHLSHNSLEGSIPHCFGNVSTSLKILHLKENLFHGLIPATFTEGCLLESLNLNGNKLEGALPESLVYCRQLQVLDVGNNEIHDTFPIWMETLPILRVLVLRSNRFNGTILLDSNTTTVPFPSLQVFDISHNEFTGTLPARYLENFVSMINVKENKAEESNWFSYYRESMEFVLKGVELSMVRILKTFTTIDMSDNRFSGAIPQFVGNLNSLRYFNLSRNNITGNIPSSLGSMSILESLDLSSNRLVGEIPLQLTNLTFLSKLNLSFNNLDGQIPQSSTGQFPTFDKTSYMGNSGLCGLPLTKKCKQDNAPSLVPVLPHGDGDSGFIDGFSWRSVALGYGSGFVFGTTIGYFIFRYERPKWFVGLFFNVQDKINYRSMKRTNVARRRRT